MTERREDQPLRRIIKEQVSTRAIDALMANYRDAQQAFMELIDNAVDNRIAGVPLLVRIRATRSDLSVHNQGGRGLDFEGLDNFFVWGYSEKTASQIGFYGIGGKSAMGYLGRGMEVVCSAKGSETEYRISDPAWESRPEGEWKEYQPEERRALTADGYFRARITNLKREVSASALAAKLGDIYRPLLLDGSVKISVNGKDVEPLQISYLETDSRLLSQHKRIQTRFGDFIDIKYGVLEEGQRVKPGIRCYYRGRLIENEQFFGLPTPAQLPQASRLMGEAHLDSVPVTPNKASFIHSSPQWDNAGIRIYAVLSPWMENLVSLRMEQRSQIESWEKDLAREAKRLLEHVFAETGLVNKSMIPGEAIGRRPPTRREEHTTARGGGVGGPGPQEGQTAPVLEATIGQIKRWGAMYEWEVASMGSTSRRSEVADVNNRKILKINSDHAMYQAEKEAGDTALRLYMADTAVQKIAEVVTVAGGKSIEEYLELVDNLSREVGAIYQVRFRQRRSVPSRGTLAIRGKK